MHGKILEIRDRATYIPVLAMKSMSGEKVEEHYLREAGYSHKHPLIILLRLNGLECHYAHYQWTGARTMKTAHQYIEENYYSLNAGDVVDVEYILGETKEKKNPQRFENKKRRENTYV